MERRETNGPRRPRVHIRLQAPADIRFNSQIVFVFYGRALTYLRGI